MDVHENKRYFLSPVIQTNWRDMPGSLLCAVMEFFTSGSRVSPRTSRPMVFANITAIFRSDVAKLHTFTGARYIIYVRTAAREVCAMYGEQKIMARREFEACR